MYIEIFWAFRWIFQLCDAATELQKPMSFLSLFKFLYCLFPVILISLCFINCMWYNWTSASFCFSIFKHNLQQKIKHNLKMKYKWGEPQVWYSKSSAILFFLLPLNITSELNMQNFYFQMINVTILFYSATTFNYFLNILKNEKKYPRLENITKITCASLNS